jgi:hypothetical protein
MILNARQNGFLINLPQDFFNPEIDKKYEKYYRNLMTPYRSLSDFMASTIQTVNFPGFQSQLPQQVRVLGKRQESQSAVPIADQFTRELKISFKLTDGWMNYFIFLDNMLNYLDFANVNPHNTQNSLGQALSVPPVASVNHPFFGPIRLTILNNEGYAFTSLIFNRPMIKGLTDFQLSYAAVKSEFKSFAVTFQYYNFDLEPEFS